MNLTLKDAKRFWSKVEIAEKDQCWIWTASVYPSGYGCFRLSNPRKQIGAHRVAYFLAYRMHPGDLFVCHHCDVRACCNPSHLFIGTHKDNMQDCRAKGRQNKGSRQHLAKLGESDIPSIRKRIAIGDSFSEIAADYGISKSQISRIKSGLHWSHV